MKPWYKTAFGREYLDLYPHRNEQEAVEDVNSILSLIDPPRNAPLLDLGCGAGRHLVALRQAGFGRLTGLDLSESLLETARRRFVEAGWKDIELLRCDMRALPFRDTFETILSLFTSFGYFRDEADDARVVRGALDALRPGGCFLLDTLAREATIRTLVPREKIERGGRTVLVERAITPDRRRVEKRVWVQGDEPLELLESVRMYTASELVAIFRSAGFDDLTVHGSVRGEPHAESSPRLVVVGRKPL